MENIKKYINYVSIGIAVIFMILMVIDSKFTIVNKFLMFIGIELLVSIIGALIVSNYKKELEKDQSFKEGEYTVCGHCGTKNRKRKAFCSKCKSSIVIKVCPVCKKVNAHDAAYCDACDSILQNVGRG